MPSKYTCFSTYIDSTAEMPTPAMVTVWAPTRPTTLPNRPAMMHAISGSSGMASSRFGFSMPASALQRVQVFDVDAPAFAEQHDEDGKTDRGLRGGHRQDKEHEHLPA